MPPAMTAYQTYQQLTRQQGTTPGYAHLLLTQEWRARRESILERDAYTCSQCHKGETLLWPHAETGVYVPHEVQMPQQWNGRTVYYVDSDGLQSFTIFNPQPLQFYPTSLHRRMHVHHRLYIYDRLPWQYANEHLETMCEHCHHQWHRTHTATLYTHTAHGLVKMAQLTPCVRCHGAGRLPMYKHVEAGICFRCRGACFEEWRK